MTFEELQLTMEATYGVRDRERGVPATVAWLAEEVGELAKAGVDSESLVASHRARAEV